MLPRDDMFYVMTRINDFLANQTILATVEGSEADDAAHRRIDHSGVSDAFRMCRAFALKIAIISAAST
jgi:hypothetical protein